MFPTRELANAHEARVHQRLDVANHPRFYNSRNAHPLAFKQLTLSQSHKSALFSEKSRAKAAAAHLGKKRGPMSDEHRRKISEAKRGVSFSDEHRQALRVAKSLTKEQRQQRAEQAVLARSSYLGKLLADKNALVVSGHGKEFFVLNVTAFTLAVGIKNKCALAARFKKMLEGHGQAHAHGYVPRRPTDREFELYQLAALQTESKYVEMGEGVAA